MLDIQNRNDRYLVEILLIDMFLVDYDCNASFSGKQFFGERINYLQRSHLIQHHVADL